MPASAGRPPEFDRDAALERAMRLFWERGYEGTSMSDLTVALGIGRQSLYGAFGGKRELFVACLERYSEQVLERALFGTLDDPQGSALAALERVLDAWEAYVKSDEFKGCLLGKSLAELGQHDSELDAFMRRKLDRIRRGVERALVRARETGELRPDANVAALARSITAFSQGAAVVCQVWREPKAVRETLQGVRDLLDAHRPERPPRANY